MGQITDMVRRDIKKYSQGEFSSEITFIVEAVTVLGICPKHHLSYDPDSGTTVSSMNAHILVDESVLNTAGIVTRDINNKITLKNRKISFADASLVEQTYTIDEVYPNGTTGILVCNLGTWH